MLQWYKPPQSILVIKKIWDNNVDEPFLQLVSWLVKEKQMKVFIENRVLEDPTISDHQLFSGQNELLTFFKEGEFDLTGQVDFIICLGGDGTLLYASSLFQSSVPPVLAFHFGSLGFLSPFDFSDFKHEVDRVLEGVHVGLVLRTRLKCEIFRGGIHDDTFYDKKPTIRGVESKNHVLALNEVVVDRGDTPYLCQLDLFIDDMLVTVVQGDGLIISTPTGSTAYAAAAGASMVHPNVPAIVITPICPHSLSFRPIVVPAGVEIKVMVPPDARSNAWVSFDGRRRQQLVKNDVLMISTSKYPLPSVCKQNPINDWFGSLAGCLHWNVRKTQSSFSLPFSSDNNTSNSESGESINGH
jgi:NAD+ kinase